MLAQKIATFTDVGNSLAHAQHLLKDLSAFKEKSGVGQLFMGPVPAPTGQQNPRAAGEGGCQGPA